MQNTTNYKNTIVTLICYLYVILFMYATTSKLLDFENFQIQIGQSPVLSAFANWISIIVPLSEVIISILLLIPKLRLVGLYAAYSLMALFTTYIYTILNYSDFIPCSCGGVLEKLSWNQHFIFNISFMVLAVIAIIIKPFPKYTRYN